MGIKANLAIEVPEPALKKRARRGWVNPQRSYPFAPRDVLVAFNDIIAERYGNGDIRDAIQGIHKRMRWTNWTLPGRQPLAYVTVEVAYRRNRQLVVGPVCIHGVPGEFNLNGDGSISVLVPEKFHDTVTQLLDDIQERLETKSIYRGAAFNNSYEFMDPAGIDFSKLVYNESVERDLRAHVWTLFQKAAQCRKRGLHFQHKVLFTGGFGTGKTMAMLLTAKMGLEEGWTVINVEQTTDPSAVIEASLEHGRRYMPTLMLIEDFDREDRAQNPRALSLLVNAIDGAMTKSGDLVVVMTTNYPDKIAPELQRPGRIDTFIEFDPFAQDDRMRLLRKVIPQEMLQEGIDWDIVSQAWDKYAPAFVNQVCESAMRYAISEADPPIITQEMLVTAAERLRRQHNACQKGMGFGK